MNNKKQKQILSNIKFSAFNMFNNNNNPIISKSNVNIMNGILYPRYIMCTILTLDKLEDADVLHFSISIKRVKGEIVSYFLNKNKNIPIPDDELSEWAKIIYGDLDNNALDFLTEQKSLLRKDCIRHLLLFFSRKTKKPIEYYKKDSNFKKFILK